MNLQPVISLCILQVQLKIGPLQWWLCFMQLGVEPSESPASAQGLHAILAHVNGSEQALCILPIVFI